jgi:hypothetical protein
MQQQLSWAQHGAAQGMQGRRRLQHHGLLLLLADASFFSYAPPTLPLHDSRAATSGWAPWRRRLGLPGAQGSCTASPPLLRLLPPSPLLLLSLVAANLGVKFLGGAVRELRLGLGSYRRPARVWSPRGTAGILGVRAQGHAARIRWWGDGHGAGAAPPPPRGASRGGRKAEAREVVAADGWGPHGSEARRCGGVRRASVG